MGHPKLCYSEPPVSRLRPDEFPGAPFLMGYRGSSVRLVIWTSASASTWITWDFTALLTQFPQQIPDGSAGGLPGADLIHAPRGFRIPGQSRTFVFRFQKCEKKMSQSAARSAKGSRVGSSSFRGSNSSRSPWTESRHD